MSRELYSPSPVPRPLAGQDAAGVASALARFLEVDLERIAEAISQHHNALLYASRLLAVNGVGTIWQFSNSTTMADPGVGQFRCDSPLLVNATQLAVSDFDVFGRDLGFADDFRNINTDDWVVVRAETGNWVRLQIATPRPVNNSGWSLFNVKNGAGSNVNPPGGSDVELQWFPGEIPHL